ncbi:MAG TPA: ParB N-terminal domain-containing protein [Candidatus Dormibacteraeota bacterium]|nr:ParB N-terminal domain-containing protein [Candidatus Dormibacteraeota bacterium]
MEDFQALDDFEAARFRAFRKAVQAALTRRARRSISLNQVLDAARLEGQADRGVRDIPLDRIVGSAGTAKTRDFDPAFLPTSRRLRHRWSRVYTAMVEGEIPPIDVYQLGDTYYVIDGHHRVSVARSLGRDTIAAHVTEVRTRAPLGRDVDAAELLRAAEYARFLEATQLDRLRPDARLECSRLGRYDQLLKHILGHKYFLGLDGRKVTLPEAAASWYDTVYLPIAEVIRRHRVLEQLPGWTEADVYVEITRRWLELSEAGEVSGPHQAVHSLLDEEARRWWRRRRFILLG